MKQKFLILFIFLILLIINLLKLINPSFNNDKNEDKYISVYLDNKKYDLLLGSTFETLLNKAELDLNDNYDISLDYVLKNNEYIYSNNSNEDRISINSASLDELIKLPGIGEKSANKIIDYRNKYGNFKHIEELKNVSGIGDKKYEKIKELITI